jgi:hypothetical protein
MKIPPDLIALINQVLSSWEVWAACAAFILFRYLAVYTVKGTAPKAHTDQSTKKLKRPAPPKQTLPKDVNTDALGLERSDANA